MKNKFPILHINDLFDRLGKGKYFTKVDLRKGYYQVRIAEGDEPKAECVTRYGAFECLVMPFGLINAPATFCTFMKKIFHPYLDQSVVENELYIKRAKCEFAQSKVHFLCHVISNGELRMDEAKVRAIQELEAPIKVTELGSFLGLVNYYRRFISGYSAKAAPLTELL
ncbi:PREDICTED: uncharacterized protein LOC109222463 [Nicotiana attenuata]|uniref:uncharacterized protein LOC109222463 n=1 Tax=Nicotiana attenuata TaxID=49451 RepID=UPI0009052752|nr:PREDICTED: uncharacterized protein LOC109222463 [Nicotiana attenuata]